MSNPVSRFFRSRAFRHSVAVWATLLLLGVIFVLTMIPLPQLPPAAGGDKLHHFIAFAAVAFPCALLYPHALVWTVPVIVAEAGLIEIIQPLVNRHRELNDFIADVIGIGIGIALGLTLRWVLKSRSRRRETQTG
ncbi:hypothetical protein [Pseudoruegeria sp. HB172150]|uniref:hypothetical protein n=1 Tax=Pseudoruegeria sp. HB172150 TaxID=2721164 RepID=UPI001552D9FC|nr:hypothetical protein [Pseudoruegeria sp. HB172150]